MSYFKTLLRTATSCYSSFVSLLIFPFEQRIENESMHIQVICNSKIVYFRPLSSLFVLFVVRPFHFRPRFSVLPWHPRTSVKCPQNLSLTPYKKTITFIGNS